MRNANKRTSMYKAGMLMLTVLILFFAASVVIMLIPGIYSDDSLISLYVINTLLVSIVSILFPTLIFIKKFAPQDFHMRRPRVSQCLLALAMGVGVFLLAAAVNSVFYELFYLTGANTDIANTPLPQMGGVIPFLTSMLVIAVIPAISEEMLFRGALLYSWRGLGRMRSAFLTALLFGLLHMSLPSFPALFLIGFILGLLAYDARSILPGVIIHFMNNALSLSVSMLETPEAAADEHGAMVWVTIAIFLVIGAAIFIPSYIGFRKISAKAQAKDETCENVSEIYTIQADKPIFPKAYVIVSLCVMAHMTLMNAAAMYLNMPGIL